MIRTKTKIETMVIGRKRRIIIKCIGGKEAIEFTIDQEHALALAAELKKKVREIRKSPIS